MKVTRYEWSTREIMKWDAIRRAHKDDSKAGRFALYIRNMITEYQLALTAEEAAEIMPEEETE